MNNKVHISLVGGQTMPIYLGVINSSADKIILIHSAETEDSAKNIQDELLKHVGRGISCLLIKFPAVDYAEVYDSASKLLEEHSKDNSVEVNLTGGTKVWAIAFAQLAQTYNAAIFYIDQNCTLYNCRNNEKKQLELPSSIAEILAYNGQHDYQRTLLDEYSSSDLDSLKEIESLRNYNAKAFNAITTLTKDNKNTFNQPCGSYSLEGGKSSIFWDKNSGIVEISIPSYNGLYKRQVQIQSPHAFHLATNAGWFEYKVATILKNWQSTKEVWTNVIFPYKNQLSKNEIDIILSAKGKLLFVECKTKVFDKTDIDKFASAVRNYGGMGSKAIFVSYSKMDPLVKEKCETNGIMYFSLERGHAPIKQLYDYLESNLSNINTR